MAKRLDDTEDRPPAHRHPEVESAEFEAEQPARDLTGLLGRIAQDCCRGADGQLEVERDYRVRTTTDLPGGIYLQGGTEHTHGITSSLLSNGAVRAGEIRDSVLARRGSELTPEPALR